MVASAVRGRLHDHPHVPPRKAGYPIRYPWTARITSRRSIRLSIPTEKTDQTLSADGRIV